MIDKYLGIGIAWINIFLCLIIWWIVISKYDKDGNVIKRSNNKQEEEQ